jgi:Mycobacterium 19 kDa lipoprotein antigen
LNAASNSRALVAIHLISNGYITSGNIAVAFSAIADATLYWGERMAFPWELNLDRPYHHEKSPLPEQWARAESTDSVFGGSPEKLEEFSVESKNGFSADAGEGVGSADVSRANNAKVTGTGEGSDPKNPGKPRTVPFRIETPSRRR